MLLKLLPSEFSLLSQADESGRPARERNRRQEVGMPLGESGRGPGCGFHWLLRVSLLEMFLAPGKTSTEAELAVGGGPGWNSFEVSFQHPCPRRCSDEFSA